MARFEPLPKGVSVDDPRGTVTMTPQGVSGVTPVVAPDGSAVTYPDVWPGVDVRYQVEGNVVKEDVILRRRPDSSTFRFSFSGTQLSADADGGLDFSGPIGTAWRVAPPEVLDVHGLPVAAADPHLTVENNGTVAALTISDTWLDSLSAADYPVTVDPTVAPPLGGAQSNSYKSDGGVCGPCPVRVGNPLQSNPGPVWRGVVYFNYTGLFGKHITDASVRVSNLTAGTPTNQWLNVYQATGWDFGSVGPWLGGSSQPGSDYTIHTNELRDSYNYWTTQQIPGIPLKFIGNENQGTYSYKEMNSFLLTLTYNDPPVVSNQGPADGTWMHSTTPTLSASFSDPNGDTITGVGYDVSTDPNFGWLARPCTWSPCAVPAGLDWNQNWYWRAWATDGYDTGYGPTWSFHPYNSAPTETYPVSPAPADGAVVHTLTPTLAGAISDVDDGTLAYYELQLTTTSTPDVPGTILADCYVENVTTGTKTCPVPSSANLVWGQTYYWHMFVSDGKAPEVYSGARSFTTSNTAPPVPTQSTPADGVTLASTALTFSAIPVTDQDTDPITGQHNDVVSYQFQVATGTDGQSGREPPWDPWRLLLLGRGWSPWVATGTSGRRIVSVQFAS